MASSTALTLDQRLTGRLLAAVIWLAVVCIPSPAGGQDVWGDLVLPGGARQARAAFSLGLPDDRPDSAWLLDFLVRELGDYPILSPSSLDQFVLTIEQARLHQAQWPRGFVLPAANAAAPDRARIESALKALGLTLTRRGNQYQAERDTSDEGWVRTTALTAAGVDLEAVALELNAGKPATISLTETRLPLPLPDYWTKHVLVRNVPPILSIARSRSHALVYIGLLALDEPTLAFLQQRPALVQRLGGDVAGAFAAFGRSLRIRNTAVEVPGDESAVDVWRELVGQHPNDAERFIVSLLGRDDGRLAYFYDTVAHLSPAKQRLVLGTELQGADRLRHVRRIAGHFASTEPQWHVARQPFSRPSFDPAVALMFIDVLPNGLIGPPWLPSLLERVADTKLWPTRPDQAFGALPEGSANALWMMDWLFQKPGETQQRFALLRFAQRLFGTAGRDLLVDAGLALLTARDMPALSRALERMSVRDPAIYRALGIATYNLTRSGDDDLITPILARWQAALGLLEQAQRRLRLSDQQIRPLLESLLKATPIDPKQAPGIMTAWLLEQLLPRLVPDGPAEDLDRRVLRALTVSQAHEPVRFSWEGLQYVANAGDTTFRSALAVRSLKLPLPTLTDLVRLHGVRRGIEGVTTLEGVGKAAAALKTLDQTLGRLAAQGEPAARLVRDLREEIQRLETIRTARDLWRVNRTLAALVEVIDLAADLTIPPIVYALAVAPTREPALYQEAWRAHSLRPPDQTFSSWMRSAWQSPEVTPRPGGGLMLRGAMLSVDIVLAEAFLIRPVPSHPAASRHLLNQERDTLLRYVAYVRNESFTEDAAVQALGDGRRRVGAWSTEIPAPRVLHDALRAAAVGDWRASVITWEAHHAELSPGEWLTPLEVLRLPPATVPAAAWHGPAPTFDGCHCLRRLDVMAPDDLRGRESGVLMPLVPNLPLRLAEHLRALELPLALLPALLPVAVQDWMDAANQSRSADWESSAGWLRRLSRERVEDYLLSLVSAGIVVPPQSPAVP